MKSIGVNRLIKYCYVFLILLSFEHAYSQCGGTSVGTFTLLKNGVPTTSPIELCPGDCWQIIPNGDAVLPPPFPGQPSQVLLSVYNGVPNLSGVPNTTLINPFSDPNYLNSFTLATITSCNYANDIPSWGIGNNLWFVPYTFDDGKVVWSDPTDQLIIDHNNDGCFAWGTPIEILYHPIPDAGTSGNVTLCTTNSPVNLFSYLGGTPQNTGAWFGPSALSGGSLGTFDPATMSPGTYLYGVGGDPSCSTVFASVTVVTNSPPNAGTNGVVTYCSTADGGNLLTELGGAPLANGTWSGPSTLGGGSSGFYNSATATPGVYTYSVTGLAPCATSTVTATVTVSEVLTPNSGIGGTLTACSNTPPVSLFSFLSGGPDANGTWNGPSVLTGGNVGTFDPATMAAGVYTYSVVGTSPCVNPSSTNVTVVINTEPDAGSANAITLCSNGAAVDLFTSLGGTPSNTGTWSGPSILSGGYLGTYDPSSMVPGNYTYTVSGLVPCANVTAVITVVEELAPDAGIDGNKDFCELGVPENLFASLGGTPSNTGTWSGPSVLTGGNLGTFDPSSMSAGVYTYTVNGISLCPNVSATITVAINPIPDAGSGNTITVCSNGATLDLFASLGGSPSNSGTWSGPSALTGGNLGSYDPAIMSPGNYVYTVTGLAPCANATATIAVVEELAPDAGVSNTKDFCQLSVPENLFASLGGTPSISGTWSGPSTLAAGNLGTFDPSLMSAGVYTYTVDGISVCSNVTATITVAINPIPDAGTGNTTTVCSNGTTIDLFSYLGGTPSNLGTWSGPSVLTGGNLGGYDPVTMSPGNYVYTVSGAAPCADATATITVMEELAPDPGVSATKDFCSNGLSEDLFAELGGAPDNSGVWGGPSLLSGGNLGTFDPTSLLAGVYTYTVDGVSVCPNASSSVTVGVITAPDAGLANTITVCSNGASVDLFASLGGTPSNLGTWSGPSVLTGGNLGGYDPVTMSPGNYVYTVSGVAPCADATATITVMEELAPDPGVSATKDFCSNGLSEDLFNELGGAPNNTGIWSGPSLLSGGNLGTFDPASLLAGVYTYTVDGVSVCPNALSSVTVGVITAPDAGLANTITVCSNGASVDLFASLGGTPSNLGTWSGPSVLTGGNLGGYDPVTMSPGNYVYTVSGVAPCADATATITVMEELAPDPGVSATKDFCSNGLSEDLFTELGGAPNNTGIWSGPSLLSGGNLGTFDPASLLAGVYTYTVDGVSVCPNALSSVTVGVITAPDAGLANTITVCSNGASVDLFASLGGTPSNLGTWSGPSVLTGGNLGGYDPVTMSPGNYVYTVSGAAPCADASTTITVVEVIAPDAGISVSHDFCSNGVVEDLFSMLGGTPDATGTWTGPSALTNGNLGGFDPATMSAGVYTYTVNGAAPCVVTSATVTVVINTVPDAGADNNITICSYGPSIDLFSLLGGTPQTTGAWSGPSVLVGGNLGTYDPGTMSPGNYVYSVSGVAPCVDVSATITVIEQLTPNAGVDATTSICISSSPVNLFSLLGSSVDITGTWSGPSALNNGHLGTYDPSIMTPGIYDYAVTGTLPCLDSIASITVLSTSAPVPVLATLPNQTDECSISLVVPTALDNCGGTVLGTTTTTSPVTTQGTTIVTWSYDDGNGNISTQTQTIIIDDVTAPVPDLMSLADITGECNFAWFPTPWALDNCGFGITGTTTTTLPITTVGTNVVEWTFDDGNGNVATANQNIIIIDTVPPLSPGPLPDVWHYCKVDSVFPRPFTWDICSGDVFGTTTTVFPITTPGTTVVTWEFDDGNGNVVTETQNIVIENLTPPLPIINSYTPWVWDECSYTPDSIPLALSDCGDTIIGVTNTIFPITTQGFSEITWYFTTAFGIVDSITQNVDITDYTVPVPDSMAFTNYLGSVQEECSYTPIAPPTATDNCAGTIVGTTTQVFPITTPGFTTFQWFYDDGNGHVTWQWQDVFITDITAPVVDSSSFVPIVYSECPYTPLSPPTAVDNCLGLVVGTSFNTYPLQQGVHWISWDFVDDDFNHSWIDQQVIVNDVTFPVLDAASLPDVYEVCELNSLTPPTASDNCLGTIQGVPWPPFPITTPGLTTINWSFTDDGYNTVSQTQNVYLIDPIAPTPDLTLLPDVVDDCAVVSLTPPTATDNCAGALVGTTSTVFPITAQGTTVVTWVYDDLRGNIVTQDQNVTINDITLPVADLASLPDLIDECTVTSLMPPTATDNCTGVVTGTTTTVLPITAQGTTIVIWSFEDASGNISTQDQNVIINDVTLPIADAVTLMDLTDECTVTSLTAPTATDNCNGVITGTTATLLPITAQGTTVVTWTYDDGNGNVSSQTQNVIIDDVTAPVPDLASLPDITDECVITSLAPPTATDNCNGAITGTTSTILPITAQGTIVVTWTYDDGNGNISTQTQNVIIDDVTVPVADIALLADVTDECAITVLTAPTATDNCNGVIIGITTTSLPITAQGTTIVTWTYDDGNGNVSTQDQNVIITDVTAPLIDLAALPDLVDGCAVSSLTAPTATDNCNGSIVGITTTVLPINAQGTTIVTWSYDDGNGNISTQTQNVIINDVSVPLVDAVSLPDLTDECNVTSLIPPTATDNCSGVVIGTTSATLPITTQGTTVVTWTFTDASGNLSTQDQDVIIDDVTVPVPDIAALLDITDECTVASLTAPTATDNCNGVITGTTATLLPITAQGTTVITWSFDDGNGNVSTQTQNVIINDVTAPVADLASLPDITDECVITSLAPPTAADNCNGTITGTTSTILPITAQGTIVVTWSYDDGNGNVSTQTQNVIITDVTAPLADLALLPNITDECTITSLTPPNATDNCNGAITGTTTTSLPITTQGTTVVSWSYDDGNGNLSTQTQDVIIIDVTAPIADVASLPSISDECAVVTLIPPIAIDNCNGVIIGTTTTSLPITTQGTTVVTWTYDDGNGNISTQDQNVIIQDVSASIPSVTNLADITGQCIVSTLVPPTAADNCNGMITGTTTTVLPITAQGTSVVTWTYDDGNGNVSTQDQNIIISPSYAITSYDTACLNTLYTFPDGAIVMILSDTVHVSNLTTVAGCDSIITTNIAMIQLLNSGIDGSINFCTTDAITDLFTQLGGAPDTSGVWSPSLQSGSGLFDPSSDVTGIYGYTTSNTCGATTSFVTVTISTNPNPGLDSMAFFCEYDQPADLFVYLGDAAEAGGTWSPSLVSGAGVFDPSIDTATVYTYSFSTICGVFSAEVAVVVIPTPTVTTIPDVQIMLGEEIELVTTTNASNYYWSPTEWLDCPNCLSPIATPEEGIEYTITVEENGCSASATVDIFVEYDLVVWVPNVFSPNGDNNNDVLFVRGKGITKLEFKVYDRWGEKVFESRDLELGWDGSFRGMAMNPSVFVYFLVVEFEDGSSVVKKGDVTLLR